jgi:zinc protease
MMSRIALCFSLLCCACAHTPPEPATAPVVLPAMDAPLPQDPTVLSGQLDNGLTWYVEHNQEPAQRAALWLVVKTGSVQEDDDQLGLAHFLEHMAFNGTEHFAPDELVAFFEAAGMGFGAHLNAYTGYDRTVYQLELPTDDADLMEQGFVVLQDFAQGMSLLDEEIEKERGVVLEEWRQGRGVQGRLDDHLRPLAYKDSRYAERKVIGTEASVQGFEHDALRRYYADWYRPELMAVIAVGDFDTEAVVARIEQGFSGLANPDSPREHKTWEIPGHEQPLFSAFSDPELTTASVGLQIRMDDPHGDSHGYYREMLLHGIVLHALNRRYSRRSRQADPPCLAAGLGPQRLNALEGSLQARCSIPEGGAERGLEELLLQVRRIRELGVTQAEVDWAVADVLQGFELALTQVDTTDNRRHAAELVRHFTSAEPMPGIAYETVMARALLQDLGADEVSAFARDWLQGDATLLRVELPAKEGLALPTQDQLATILAASAVAELEPIDREGQLPPLIEATPAPGAIVDRVEHPDLGATVWTLSNGAEIWIKPTAFQKDQVLFRAFSHGGYSLVPDEDYIAGKTAGDITALSGLGPLDLDELMQSLAGKQVGLQPYIGDHSEGLKGGAIPRDLELCLQLVHLVFTQPRFDAQALETERMKRTRKLENRLENPDNVFYDAYGELMWQGHPRERSWTVQTLEQMDLARSQAVFEQRFADIGDFTFVFVGSVTPEQLEPLVLTWLASLPTQGISEVPSDNGARRIRGTHEQTVRAGLEPKSRARITWNGDLDNTWLNRNRLAALEDILQVLLREELREERGGTYHVSVGSDTWQFPEPGYRLTINFRCDPDRVEELLQATMAIIERLQTEGVDAKYVKREQAKNRRSRQTRIEENDFWTSAIAGALRRGEDPHDLLTWDDRNDSLTATEIQQAAQLYLSDDVVTVVLLPEDEG